MRCPHCKHDLTFTEIASLNGQRSAAMRITRSGGRKPTCECGECKKCQHRASMRKWRARLKYDFLDYIPG